LVGNREVVEKGLGENNRDLLEADFWKNLSESALNVTSGLPVLWTMG